VENKGNGSKTRALKHLLLDPEQGPFNGVHHLIEGRRWAEERKEEGKVLGVTGGRGYRDDQEEKGGSTVRPPGGQATPLKRRKKHWLKRGLQ